jgi:hypothetical protein
MALQNLILPILSVFRSAGLQQASGALRGLTSNFESLAGKIGLAAGSFGAFSALTSARQFTIDSVNATAQFERNLLGLNQVFENITPQIRNFTKQVENYGLSQSQAAQASVFLGSVLKQYGFTTQQSADQTERLVTLAQDLATTYGYDLQTALLAITALFRGEYDPIEKFGVAMKQSEVNARLAAEGMGDLEGEALALAQAQARLTMLFERADDAVGAFTRASDTLYASQQRLNAIVGNLQVAFGTPLQKPLAEVNNIFADLAQEFGPQVVDIANSLGGAIESLAPFIKVLGESFFLLLAPLQQVIDLLSMFLNILGAITVPVLDAANKIGNLLVLALDASTSSLSRATKEALDLVAAFLQLERFDFTAIQRGADAGALGALFGLEVTDIEGYLERLTYKNETAMGKFYDDTTFALNAVQRMSAAQLEASQSGQKLEDSLRGIATGAVNAEGKLGGLAGVFKDIDDAIEKSNAKQSMEDLGLSAAFIEEALKRPNWKEIFELISTYAKLAAIDITKVLSLSAAVGLSNTKAELEKRLNELFAETDAKTTGKKTGKSFFEGLTEEVAKQAAASKLRSMKATEGLVQAILGTDSWEATYKRIVAMGPAGLARLQQQFNKTADGIQELADAAKVTQEAFDKLYEKAIQGANDYIKAQQQLADKAKADFERIEDAAENYKETIADFASIEILPNIEAELGRFEQAVVSSVERIRSELKSAFRQDLIYRSDFDNISTFVAAEEAALINIAKQRDAMAKKLSLSETLIGEYQRALTGALQLTSLFSKLKGETEKRTITEVQKGVVALGRSLREFEVTVTRSYEEPIQVVQNKTEGLLQGFRDMAAKSRDFAENLRRLKALGLDPMLFNQLVQAGAEAGGETAQGIVDGGQAAVNELNTIFDELNKLGAELGMDVGMTMYEAGKDMTYGLLEGIKSEQERLLALARSMAEAFSREFQSRLSIAVDVPVADAKKEMEKAAAAVPKIENLDTASIQKILGLLQKANQWLGMTKNMEELSRTRDVIKIYESILKDLTEFKPVDVSGISRGMSVLELKEAALRGGAQTVNNITLEVYADSQLSGARAGQAIVEKLESFTRANGGGGGLLAQVL